MAKPWEKYQGEDWEPETASGPWDNYTQEEPAPEPEKEEDATSTFERVVGRVRDGMDWLGETGYAYLSNHGRTALGNYADEIGAAGRSLYDIATEDQYELRHYDDLYDINKQLIQDHYDDVDSRSPIASVAGNVGGAVAGAPAVAAGKYIAGASGVVPAVGRSLVAGAGEGALLASGSEDIAELNEDGSNAVDRYLDYGSAIAEGAGWGAAGGMAGGAVGVLAGPLAKRIWRGLGRDQKAVAIKEIRDRALEYGVDPDEVISMLDKNPNLTLADVDVAMRDMARGLGQRNPRAMNEARGTLVERNRQAPERIGEALEEASGIPLNRADDIAGEAKAARQELSPAYNEIDEANVPFSKIDTDVATPHMPIDVPDSPARQIIELMPDEYNAALANYRRAIKDPNFDPVKAGHIPGAMIQDMKKAADTTIGSATASGAQVNAAKSVKSLLLDTADEYIPGYGPLREEYGRRVLQPEAGLEAARGYMQGGWEKLQDMLGRAGQLTEVGKEAFDAAVVRSANNAVRNAPGAKGTQNYAGPLTRSETAGERVAEVIPDARRSQFDEALEDELTMHTTMNDVTGAGSPTNQNKEAAFRSGEGNLLDRMRDGFINRLTKAESQTEAMKILLDSNLTERELREILESPYIGKPVREMIDRYLSSEHAGSGVLGAAGGLLIPEAMN